jgi:tetratricopeptide (TPR) repeat protein
MTQSPREAEVAEGRAALEAGDAAAAELRAFAALRSGEHLGALLLLRDCRRPGKASGPAYENLLTRILKLDADDVEATLELAILMFARGERVECERHARNALRLAPRVPRAHAVMGLVLAQTNRAAAGEFHLRRVVELEGEKAPIAVHLADCLKAQGKLDEAETWYGKATALDVTNFDAWIGWCRLAEARHDIARAREFLANAEAVSNDVAATRLMRAVLLGREKRDAEALAQLSLTESGALGPMALLERGRLYDRMQRFDEAWADFDEAKRLCRDVQGLRYDAERAGALVARLTQFFTRGRMSLLPRAARDENLPQPIFVVGFPRSGTTMVEQILSAHPQVSAGDELVFIDDLARVAQRWLGSPQPYPACLADLWLGDNRFAPGAFRDHYLKGAERQGVFRAGARFFTDKMPLNETHLGLIHILFPHAPIVHVRRHPLDVVVSNFANFLTHGFRQAFDVKSSAEHYALIDALVEHYRRELDLNYLELRYEDMVGTQESQVRRLLDFLGLDFDPACLAFHRNRRAARTASYAQVTEELHDASVGRHRHYARHLGEAVAILDPVLKRLGYRAG